MTKHKASKLEALPPVSLYIHIPWCVQKCPYCDFNSHAVKKAIDSHQYLEALVQNLDEQMAFLQQRKIKSIFIGGGTPSIMDANFYQQLLDEIRNQQILNNDIEITIEVNPGTADCENFSGYRQAGINRISIGMQSMNDQQLNALGRIHNAQESVKAIALARQAGFDNINCDLMYGLPTQTTTEALSDLEAVINLQPQHLSWYQLTIEPNTAFHVSPPKDLPNNDQLWDTQLAGQALLAEHGYRQYEISAYHKDTDDFRCRHNLNYWEFGDYLAIGAGAHGKVTLTDGDVIRYSQQRHPDAFVSDKPFTKTRQTLSLEDQYQEFLLNNLRLNKGFSAQQLQMRTHQNPEMLSVLIQQDNILNQLIIIDNNSIKPSSLGHQHLNETIQRMGDLWEKLQS